MKLIFQLIIENILIYSFDILLYSFNVSSLLIDWCWPKKRELMLFPPSYVPYTENSNSLHDYAALQSEFEAFRFEPPKAGKMARFRYCIRPSVFFKIMYAKTVFLNCSFSDFYPFTFSRRKYVVQLWHGSIGFKGQILTEPGLDKKTKKRYYQAWKHYDIYVTPSWMGAYVMCINCNYDIRKVFLCGVPRNDSIVNHETPRNAYLEQLKAKLPVKRFVLYAPTYRRNRPARIFPFDDFNPEILNDFLDKHEAAILIRTHPSDSGGENVPYGPRVLKFMSEQCTDINSALHYCDVLITDYSSIYVDFLLLNRPLVFLLYDFDQYAKEVGLVCDNYDFWTPGPKPNTFAEFLATLDKSFTTPEAGAERRLALNTIYNAQQTGDSSKRILAMVKERVK